MYTHIYKYTYIYIDAHTRVHPYIHTCITFVASSRQCLRASAVSSLLLALMLRIPLRSTSGFLAAAVSSPPFPITQTLPDRPANIPLPCNLTTDDHFDGDDGRKGKGGV